MTALQAVTAFGTMFLLAAPVEAVIRWRERRRG